MQKLSVSYLFWKAVTYLLVLVMTLAVTIPLYYLMRSGNNAQLLSSIVSSVAGFVIFLLFDYFFVLRSNLSKISKKNYLIGETVCFAIWTVTGSAILFIASKGNTPVDFSYAGFLFLPALSMGYLLKNIVLGAILQILIFALLFAFLYTLKKKKDPTLEGAKRTAVSQNTIEGQSEEQDNTEKEREQEDDRA